MTGRWGAEGRPTGLTRKEAWGVLSKKRKWPTIRYYIFAICDLKQSCPHISVTLPSCLPASVWVYPGPLSAVSAEVKHSCLGPGWPSPHGLPSQAILWSPAQANPAWAQASRTDESTPVGSGQTPPPPILRCLLHPRPAQSILFPQKSPAFVTPGQLQGSPF